MKKCLCLFFLTLQYCTSPNKPPTAEFVQIKAGTYLTGQKNHPLNPLKTVKVTAFSISATEVTNAQFANFVEFTHYLTDAEN